MLARTRIENRASVVIALTIALVSGCSGSSGTNSGNGGTTSDGGATTGGVTTAGGAVTGGSSANTSAKSTGGTLPTGGATATGGSVGSGGALPTGGRPATGGESGGPPSGGAANTGGSHATGGSQSSATGGRVNTGGSNSATGGSRPTGGGPATGGKSSTGGAVSTGGSTSSGTCPTPALKAGDSTVKITVGSLNREYILHVPSAYTGSSPVPLVLDFHPIGGSDTSWRSGSPYPAVIDKEGVISAFPNGEPSPNLGNAWNVEGCCTSKINGADVDDIAFAKAIVADIEKVACIDPKRVYAVGFSMGGGMSNYIACHAAETFAAVGPASFDLTQQNVGGCAPSRPITVIEWRGKNDNVVPYAGGHSALVTGMAIDFLGAVGTFQKWASLDGCTGNPGAADSNNCQTYAQCTAGVQVTLCTDNNGGHEAANANVVWPILKKYTLP